MAPEWESGTTEKKYINVKHVLLNLSSFSRVKSDKQMFVSFFRAFFTFSIFEGEGNFQIFRSVHRGLGDSLFFVLMTRDTMETPQFKYIHISFTLQNSIRLFYSCFVLHLFSVRADFSFVSTQQYSTSIFISFAL